jgi:hypothetical protein
MAGAVAPGAVQRAERAAFWVYQTSNACVAVCWVGGVAMCFLQRPRLRHGPLGTAIAGVWRWWCQGAVRHRATTRAPGIHLQLHCTSVFHLHPPEHRSPPRVNLPPHRAYPTPRPNPLDDPESAASLHLPPCRPECSRDNGLEAPAPGSPSSSWCCSVRYRPMCIHVTSANRCR